MKIVEAVASSSVKTSFNLQTPYIVCLTPHGRAAKGLSKYRPFCPVICYAPKKNISTSISIFRGLFPIVLSLMETDEVDSVITFSNEFLIKNKLVPMKTNIVLMSGKNETKSGTIDQMRIININ
jgi:pyruvate kinase